MLEDPSRKKGDPDLDDRYNQWDCFWGNKEYKRKVLALRWDVYLKEK